MTAKQITGSLLFQKHNRYGETVNGERMPFGYISTRMPMPIFELNVPLDWPEEELLFLARQMAAARDMFDLLQLIADPAPVDLDLSLSARNMIKRIKDGQY